MIKPNKKKTGMYKYIDMEFDAINDPHSGYSYDNNFYSLKSLIQAVKDQNATLEKLYINSMRHLERWNVGCMTMAEAYLRIQNADLNIPVIIDYDGALVDGYHRIVKAIIQKKPYVMAYRINVSEIDIKV